ncbi:hypothetical protein EDD11_008238 [Mortierella claussenii]|nr:hypothetical protein EDD11_008238 [Mortierella claussenii]
MEGLLGGLIKDKDPRAEIVRAELDAMAREAEMTGLKLRRSKAYEEISHAMSASTASGSGSGLGSVSVSGSGSGSGSGSVPVIPKLEPSSSSSSVSRRLYNGGNEHHTQSQPLHGHQQHFQPHPPGNVHSLSHLTASASQQASMTFTMSSTPASNSQYGYNRGTRQEYSQNYSPQRPHDYRSEPHLSNTYSGQKYPLPQQDSVVQLSSEPYPSSEFSSHGPYGSRPQPDSPRRPSYVGQHHHRSQVNPLTGYMPMPQSNTEYDTGVILPAPDVMDHLLDIHFRFIHPVLPMFHRRTLYEQLQRRESLPPHLLFAVLGLASRFSDNPVFRTLQPGTDRPACTVFYERAKLLIKDEYDHSQIGTVQALLLMSIQQMGFCESQRAWLYVGMAIRMAQDLGLNKEQSEQEQARDRLSAELRKRTWWSCFVVERLVCAGLGRPLTIAQQECETGFPQYDTQNDYEATGDALVESSTLIPNFVHLITLSRIQGNILQFIKARAVQCDETNDNPPHNHKNSSSVRSRNGNSHSSNMTASNSSSRNEGYRVDTSSAAFSALDRSLAEWRQQLPEALQEPTPQSPHFGLFLHMTYNTLVILLHRPEMVCSAMSASMCAQAAATITEITEILMQAKALTSMFISCLYAIFSAGIIHFINIPGSKRATSMSSSTSPTIPSTTQFGTPTSSSAPSSCNSSNKYVFTAKADLKRCIDALKHLSSHWVSAARRAKVLEDLLDLKHVSLKDLEEDSFKTAPLLPAWAVETSGYGKVLAVPREDHDRLRQQCRSKMMAIQSLLATDDEFQKMQRRSRNRMTRSRSSSLEEMHMEHEEYDMDATAETTVSQHSETLNGHHLNNNDHDDAMDVTVNAPILSITTAAKAQEASLPSSSSSALSPNAHRLNEHRHQHHQQRPLDADPMMLISTASPSPPRSGMIDHEAKRSITPMTLTTLGLQNVSVSGNGHSTAVITSTLSQQSAGGMQLASMLDPFSMPSSITFPEQSPHHHHHQQHGRQSNGGTGTASSENGYHVSGPQSNTVWSTDVHTQRAVARAEPVAMGHILKEERQEDTIGRTGSLQPLNMSEMATKTTMVVAGGSCSDDRDCEELWNDMPPTLGLDEWMAYIGALMMRWLASGESSPRSTASH